MSNVGPTRKQFEKFKNLPRDTPIMMLNLIKLNKRARYEDARKATGEEAYATYNEESSPIVASVGGTIIWRGKPESVLIGPQDERWDLAFISHFPNSKAFLDMVTEPAYQAIAFHRQAAVKDSRLIRMGETEAGISF